MRICYLANAASVHTQRWAHHFARRSWNVIVVSFQPGEIEGIEVIQMPSRSSQHRLNILLNLGKVRNLVRKINPDILHAHYVTSYGLAGAISGRHPLVITAWGSDVLVRPEKSWAYRQIVRFALKRADLITSMADHMTQHLVEKGYAQAQKIVTLPFGVDTEIFNPNRRSSPTTHDSSLIVSTRRLDRGLDVHVFIRAAPHVLESCGRVRFAVAGDGPLRAELEELANDLGIASHIEFLGAITHQDMSKLLGEADVFVSTSPSDGNNISLNEAMACGAFPVATDIAANRAWIQPGENGLLFSCQNADELAQKIIEAIGRPEWRQAAMAKNWEIVRTKASWAWEMAKMEKAYEALVTRRD